MFQGLSKQAVQTLRFPNVIQAVQTLRFPATLCGPHALNGLFTAATVRGVTAHHAHSPFSRRASIKSIRRPRDFRYKWQLIVFFFNFQQWQTSLCLCRYFCSPFSCKTVSFKKEFDFLVLMRFCLQTTSQHC